MKPARFKYVRSETAEQAVDLLRLDPGAKILAGGQSLVPALSARTVSPSVLIDIMKCPGLNEVSETKTKLTVGATCRQSFAEKSPQVRRATPLLSEALGWVAMPQVRSRGTVVGCLAQGNPGAEVPAVALALDGEINVLTSGGARETLRAADIYAAESGVLVPPRSMIESASFRTQAEGEGWGFSEIQLRQGHFALACCAVTMQLDESRNVRAASIAIGGLTANPYRARRAERALSGQNAYDDVAIRAAAHTAVAERPWHARTDLHATAEFRIRVAVVALTRALTIARNRCHPYGVVDQ
ncbi:MAG TPA: FAD binding domain-containing protein [Candidatus Aquilonibacter sp.]|nr:FAD binding domain-containing protein [Candidatus Aquilonibacter sp.]